MLVKCHGKPENHVLPCSHGTSTPILYKIDINAMRKKLEGLAHSLYLNVRNMRFPPYDTASTNHTSTKN